LKCFCIGGPLLLVQKTRRSKQIIICFNSTFLNNDDNHIIKLRVMTNIRD